MVTSSSSRGNASQDAHTGVSFHGHCIALLRTRVCVLNCRKHKQDCADDITANVTDFVKETKGIVRKNLLCKVNIGCHGQ